MGTRCSRCLYVWHDLCAGHDGEIETWICAPCRPMRMEEQMEAFDREEVAEEGGGEEVAEEEGGEEVAEEGGGSRDMLVSPKRQKLREEAAESLERQGKKMQARVAGGNEVPVGVGTVVQVAVSNVDRSKVDSTNVTLVVVEVVHTGKTIKETKYRLACAAGVVNALYTRSYIAPQWQATPLLMGLDKCLSGWQGLPRISIRACVAVQSAVGGQGMTRCDCAGKCATLKCSCFKADRKCNSRCHKGSQKCCNLDD